MASLLDMWIRWPDGYCSSTVLVDRDKYGLSDVCGEPLMGEAGPAPSGHAWQAEERLACKLSIFAIG